METLLTNSSCYCEECHAVFQSMEDLLIHLSKPPHSLKLHGAAPGLGAISSAGALIQDGSGGATAEGVSNVKPKPKSSLPITQTPLHSIYFSNTENASKLNKTTSAIVIEPSTSSISGTNISSETSWSTDISPHKLILQSDSLPSVTNSVAPSVSSKYTCTLCNVTLVSEKAIRSHFSVPPHAAAPTTEGYSARKPARQPMFKRYTHFLHKELSIRTGKACYVNLVDLAIESSANKLMSVRDLISYIHGNYHVSKSTLNASLQKYLNFTPDYVCVSTADDCQLYTHKCYYEKMTEVLNTDTICIDLQQ